MSCLFFILPRQVLCPQQSQRARSISFSNVAGVNGGLIIPASCVRHSSKSTKRTMKVMLLAKHISLRVTDQTVSIARTTLKTSLYPEIMAANKTGATWPILQCSHSTISHPSLGYPLLSVLVWFHILLPSLILRHSRGRYSSLTRGLQRLAGFPKRAHHRQERCSCNSTSFF